MNFRNMLLVRDVYDKGMSMVVLEKFLTFMGVSEVDWHQFGSMDSSNGSIVSESCRWVVNAS